MGGSALRIVLFLASALIFALGFAAGISSFEEYLLQIPVSETSIELVEAFTTIFCRNLIVGLLISVLGFFTAGIASVMVLFWNGLIVGRFFNVPSSDLWEVSRYFVFHGGFELTAFFLFGAIGLRGVAAFRNLIVQGALSSSLKLSFREFVWPVSLLFVAAVVESCLIVCV